MSDDAAPDDPRVVARRWPLGRRQRVWLSFIRRRWGRVAAVAAIAAGVVGIVGHLMGGVAGSLSAAAGSVRRIGTATGLPPLSGTR